VCHSSVQAKASIPTPNPIDSSPVSVTTADV
jgi:hypothetical protein